jgi:hypothetical protein
VIWVVEVTVGPVEVTTPGEAKTWTELVAPREKYGKETEALAGEEMLPTLSFAHT